MTQRKLRVVGAVRQDKNINAISIAIGIRVRGVVAGIVVGLVRGQVTGLGAVMQPIPSLDLCRRGRAAGPEEQPVSLTHRVGKVGDDSHYVIWQEGPIAAVLEAVARSWLGESPGRADTLGPAVGGTGVESR